MTNANYIQWLETMIVGCDDLGGMEREKAIYQNCLKKARNLGQTLPIQRVSNAKRTFCNNCKSGLIDYPEISRRTCSCGALGYNVTE